MSYARFRNTLTDLRDCYEALSEGLEELSDEERLAARRLVEQARRLAEDYEHLLDVKPLRRAP